MRVSLGRFLLRPAVCGLILSVSYGQVSAAPFLWFNDPSSTVDNSATTFSITNNVLTLTGGVASNLTTQPLADVGFFVPFMWPRVPTTTGAPDLRIPMTWSNTQDGWFNADFNGTGTSLLVTLDILAGGPVNGHVAAGSIAADETLTSVFGPTSDDIGAPFPTETLLAGDLLPFVDLGSFGPLESKPFDLMFTYQWGDGRTCCALRNTGADFTLAPVSTAEPASLVLLGAGLASLALARRRRN